MQELIHGGTLLPSQLVMASSVCFHTHPGPPAQVWSTRGALDASTVNHEWKHAPQACLQTDLRGATPQRMVPLTGWL